MSEPTPADREAAATVMRMWHTDDARTEAIAAALAWERERVLWPVRALADTWEQRASSYSAHDERDKAIEARQRATAVRNAIEENR